MARKSPPPRRRAATKRVKPRPAAKRKAAARKTSTRKAAKPRRATKSGNAARRPAAKAPRKAVAKSRPKAAAKPRAKTRPQAKVKAARKPLAAPRAHKPFPEIDERVPVGPPSTLQRERRVLSEDERLEQNPVQADERVISAARTGHEELRQAMGLHTESSPTLTAGDVDAKWEDAYAVGDEAPGGDNPTPDQQRVDDIGKALGINYQDNEELQGGDELVERDKHRWEMDPASSDDWPHDK